MWGNIVYGLVSMQYIIGAAAILCVVLTFAEIFVFSANRKGLGHYGWQAALLGLNYRNTFLLASVALQVLFVSVGIISGLIIIPATLGAFLGLTAVVCILEIACKRMGALPEHILYATMAAAALIAGRLLRDFMADTGFNLYMFIVEVLLCLFVVQYSVYHGVKCVERMMITDGSSVRKPRKAKAEKPD